MTTYIVTFELNPGVPGPTVADVIKTYSNWIMITETSYGIVTDQSAAEIYDALKPELGVHKKIYIVALTEPFFGYGPSDINSWFQNNV